ncbi:MAG: bifunctional oligoribonuclease/PAP phosphatase NrnA [Bradymonadales bacterium]|nr:bifunctional oligoribonuclease/PAP phosphatase NrnA [Bradymonadales bacterium]
MTGGSMATEEIPGGSPDLADQLERASAYLHSGTRFLVCSHEAPDGDAIGSTLALANLLWDMGKQATPYNRDGVPYNFRFLPGADRLVAQPEGVLDGIDTLLILDCASLKRVDSRLVPDREKTRVVCIDHHETVDPNGPDLLVLDAAASCVGEILYRWMHRLSVLLSTPVAECLYVSVHTDTGGFRYQNTTPAALALASRLVGAGVDVWKVTSEVYENHPPGRVKLLSEVLDTLHISACGRIAFITVTQEMYRRTSTGPEMLDGFINFARGIIGVEVAGQLRELEHNRYRVSFRSRGRVDVARLAQKFGGGGHQNAAGCTIEGPPAQIIGMLTAKLDQLLGSATS